MNVNLEELYRERAELARWESEISSMKGYSRVDGLWWKILTWLEGRVVNQRIEVQEEIAYREYLKNVMHDLQDTLANLEHQIDKFKAYREAQNDAETKEGS